MTPEQPKGGDKRGHPPRESNPPIQQPSGSKGGRGSSEDYEDDEDDEDELMHPSVGGEVVPLFGVTLTGKEGGKLKIKEGRGHEDLTASVLRGGEALAVSWDGCVKLELDANNSGFRYIQGGEARIDLTQDDRRPLAVVDDGDAELQQYMKEAAEEGGVSELKLVLGGNFTDDDARMALAPIFSDI